MQDVDKSSYCEYSPVFVTYAYRSGNCFKVENIFYRNEYKWGDDWLPYCVTFCLGVLSCRQEARLDFSDVKLIDDAIKLKSIFVNDSQSNAIKPRRYAITRLSTCVIFFYFTFLRVFFNGSYLSSPSQLMHTSPTNFPFFSIRSKVSFFFYV